MFMGILATALVELDELTELFLISQTRNSYSEQWLQIFFKCVLLILLTFLTNLFPVLYPYTP